jgi:hypothetical protein
LIESEILLNLSFSQDADLQVDPSVKAPECFSCQRADDPSEYAHGNHRNAEVVDERIEWVGHQPTRSKRSAHHADDQSAAGLSVLEQVAAQIEVPAEHRSSKNWK